MKKDGGINRERSKKLPDVNCTSKVRQNNLTFRSVFIVKLTYNNKLKIYELRKKRQNFKQLSNRFGVDISRQYYPPLDLLLLIFEKQKILIFWITLVNHLIEPIGILGFDF